jgi:hypothetical protein
MNYSSISRAKLLAGSVLCMFYAVPAQAYPEFQEFAEKKSGRTVDCAMCHTAEHGPVGEEDGQIGKLSADELALLNQARAAMEPGSKIHNPILNEFGNQIVKELGMKRVLEAKASPESLPAMLDQRSDLDDDGIANAQEFQQGTHPLNKFHGDPWQLFVNNLLRYKVHVMLAFAAVLLIDYGIAQIIKGMYMAAKAKRLRKSGAGSM